MDKQKILEIGLQMEKSARSFYEASAKLVADPGAAQMLRELAVEEERHIQMFEDALAGKEVAFGKDAPEPGQDLKLGEVLEAPSMTPTADAADALIIAIKAEMRAIQFYSESAKTLQGTETEEMMKGLVREEQAHKAMLERLYDDEYLQDN
jgi:rubrerythrin